MKKLFSIILCVCLMASASHAEKITDLFKDAEVQQQRRQMQTGYNRIVNTLENVTGEEVYLESLEVKTTEEPIQTYMLAKVQTDNWANGYWILQFCNELPDVSNIKNSIWYVYYDENFTKLGYVLGVHIKTPVATNSNTTVERF